MYEISNPINPITPRPRIKPPNPNRDDLSSGNSGTAKGGGGVNVGIRVCVGWMLKAAAKVGSMVAVTGGVAVGGDSTTGSSPPETMTYTEYTQPLPLGP